MDGNQNKADDFTPREYQTEIFDKAIEQNIIIFLPTGSGKTYIATMIIKHMSKDIIKSFREGGKRTFFLVCTVTLAQQQSASIQKLLPESLRVGSYTGDMGVDFWKRDKWLEEFENYQVIVMTAQIFLDLLHHNYITFPQVNLLILDECHHAVSKHPMSQIMSLMKEVHESGHPKIVGLTATLLNANIKPHKVDEEIRNLETTLKAKICRSRNEAVLKSFSTNPMEKIVSYDVETDNLYPYIKSCLDELCYIVKSIKPSDEGVKHMEAPDGSILLIDKKTETDKVYNMIQDICKVGEDLGSFAASYALLVRLFNFERLKSSCEDKNLYYMYCAISTMIHKVRKTLLIQMEKVNPGLQPFIFSTPKLKALLEELQYFDSNSSAIVFVTRRLTAIALYYVFKHTSTYNDDYQGLKPDFIVGVNANPYNQTREPELERKNNKKTMDKFNSKETNILFASSVVEEGMDIRHCNSVIKLDYPTTLCSYIQSKGRARMERSTYIIFVPTNHSFFRTYDNYKELEQKVIKEFSYGRDELRRSGLEELELKSSLIKPFYVDGPGSASVTMESAISLLNRYCSVLPADKYTTLTVVYWKKIIQDRRVIVKLQLPMNSPLRETIESQPFDKSDLAKAHAAFEACKRLYQLGELDKKLLPIGPAFEIEEKTVFPLWIDNDEEGIVSDTSKRAKPGTKKRLRVYDKRVPRWLCGCTPKPNVTTYIHIIKIKPVYECPDTKRHGTFYNLLASSNTFALLSSKKWPTVCKFPLFMNVGEVEIDIKNNYLLKKFTEHELEEIFDFHCLIVTQALPLKKKFLVKDYNDNSNSYYIAPVLEKRNYDIDWKTIRGHKSIPETKPLPVDVRKNLVVTKDNYYCKVVIPWYRPVGLKLRYIVTCVCEDQTPLSPFPSDAFESYSHYFSSRYEQKILNKDQPLLEVRAISQKNNCLLPRGQTCLGKRKKRDEEELEEVLVPELCFLLEFPAVYLLKVTLIPSVVHRLTQLFLAEELRIKIADQVGLGRLSLPDDFKWENMKLDDAAVNREDDSPSQMKSTIEVTNTLASKIKSLHPEDCPWDKEEEPLDIYRNLEDVDLLTISNYVKFVNSKLTPKDLRLNKPPPRRLTDIQVPDLPLLRLDSSCPTVQLGELIQVFITNVGSDIVNYERLETLGDSFLKFMSSLVLFTQFPDKDEGKLTYLKGKIVGNRNLFYSGRHLGLGSMMKVAPFSADDWDIPHYGLLESIKIMLRDVKRSPSLLYDVTLTEEECATGLLKDSTRDLLFELICNAGDNIEGYIGGLNILQQQAVQDKVVADAVEALIGVYLQAYGLEGAFKLCKWLKILPNGWADIQEVLYEPAPSAHLHGSLSVDDILLLPDEFERSLGYKFRDRSYLLQALSHPSYFQFATDCYQRLEFLGDAILDFLITSYIYENSSNLGPGELTDLRSSLVNNETFACLTVKYGFHKYVLLKVHQLSNLIMKFAEQQEKRNHLIGSEVLLLVNEADTKVGEMMDIPKILGDIFESLAGAVYLDSGKSLEAVWRVFYRLMENEIREFSKNVPKNSIRLLFEKFPVPLPVFSTPKEWDKAKGYLIEVTVIHNSTPKSFYGFGSNKSSAKLAAAKIALRHFHENSSS